MRALLFKSSAISKTKGTMASASTSSVMSTSPAKHTLSGVMTQMWSGEWPGVRTMVRGTPQKSMAVSPKAMTRSTGQMRFCSRSLVRTSPMVKLNRWFFRLCSQRTMSASIWGRQTLAP